MTTTTDPIAIIDQLNERKATWRDLSMAQRKNLVSHLLSHLSADNETMTIANFQRSTPDWLPKNGRFLIAPFKCDWRTLVENHGMRVDARYSHNRGAATFCECGELAIKNVEIEIGTPNGNLRTTYLPLCAQHLAEHYELEGGE